MGEPSTGPAAGVSGEGRRRTQDADTTPAPSSASTLVHAPSNDVVPGATVLYAGCSRCQVGRVSVQGALSCTRCTGGKQPTDDSSGCENCPGVSQVYSEEEARCADCGPNQVARVDPRTQARACVCKDGWFNSSLSDGSTLAIVCLGVGQTYEEVEDTFAAAFAGAATQTCQRSSSHGAPCLEVKHNMLALQPGFGVGDDVFATVFALQSHMTTTTTTARDGDGDGDGATTSSSAASNRRLRATEAVSATTPVQRRVAVLRCPRPEECPNTPPSNATQQAFAGVACKQGHSGALCANCAPTYTRAALKGNCYQCEEGGAAYLPAILAAVGALLLFVRAPQPHSGSELDVGATWPARGIPRKFIWDLLYLVN